MRFEPEGITGNPEIPFAKSMPDYIMRWLASRFLDVDAQEELGILTPAVRARKAAQDATMAMGVLGHRRPQRRGAGSRGARRVQRRRRSTRRGGVHRLPARRARRVCRASTSGPPAASAAA